MCNLYKLSAKDDIERYVRKLSRSLFLPDCEPGTVGPFGTGLFLKAGQDGLVGELGQWALIKDGQQERKDWIKAKDVPGKKTPAPRARSTNNARIEPMDGLERRTNAADVWRAGRRCLIPAEWYQEPNWETEKNIWWHLRRADGAPWFIAGLYSEGWVDPVTGEILSSFTMITVNCNDHPMLSRLHKPDRDPVTKEVLPMDQQDKRSLVHVAPDNWDTWLRGSLADARALLEPPSLEVIDQTEADATDAALAKKRQLF